MSYNVINYHFTNACNYMCEHCFVNKCKREVSFETKLRILDAIYNYFKSNEIVNPRINLVGGEPFIEPRLGEMIEYIYAKGISVSIVTNGSLITKEFLEKYSPCISMIGISVDALTPSINKDIGRCTRSGKTMNEKEMVDVCKMIKSFGIKLKINMCVSKRNKHENFIKFLMETRPDRAKLLAMSLSEGINDSVKDLALSNEEYSCIYDSISKYGVVREEPNSMHNAYFMVNSEGEFFVNDNGKETIVCNILTSKINQFHLSKLNEEKYQNRY